MEPKQKAAPDVRSELRAIPERHAQPDPRTLSTVPKGGAQLLYMGHAEVTLALIDADPEWTWEPAAIDPQTGGPVIIKDAARFVMWGRLIVCGKSIMCVGTCEARKSDPEKELVGDMIRNGAMRFGIGTKLWSKAVDAEPARPGSRRQTPQNDDSDAVDLLERCKLADEDVKAELRRMAEAEGRKIGVQSFVEDRAWADKVRMFVMERAA